MPVPASTRSKRAVLVGAGGMGRFWARTIAGAEGVELAGVVDLDVVAAQSAADDSGAAEAAVGDSLSAVAADADADLVVNVTIPAAHLPVTMEALRIGLPVLTEKPIAPTLQEALRLTAAAEVAGVLLATSQSRRHYRSLARFREAARLVAPLGILTTEYFMAPRFGGFRDEMAFPLLLDMAIHPFDVARYLTGSDPVAVRCESFSPPWSWYAGDAAVNAVFEFEGGLRYVYTGSWCSPGLETSWNGSWRVSGARGAATWDGEHEPDVQSESGDTLPEQSSDTGPESIGGALAEFLGALRSGDAPSGEVHANVLSLAMVEAAVVAASSGARVVLADLLEQAYDQALRAEPIGHVRDRLWSWGTASAGLHRGSVPTTMEEGAHR